MEKNADAVKGMEDFYWVNWVPIKINCFTWGVLCNRIMVACKLIEKRVRLDSMVCSFCGE